MINTDYGKKNINQQQRVNKGNEYWNSDAPTTLSSHTTMLTLKNNSGEENLINRR